MSFHLTLVQIEILQQVVSWVVVFAIWEWNGSLTLVSVASKLASADAYLSSPSQFADYLFR